jgi:hypothetical protein
MWQNVADLVSRTCLYICVHYLGTQPSYVDIVCDSKSVETLQAKLMAVMVGEYVIIASI